MAVLRSKTLKKSLEDTAHKNARVTRGTSKDQKVLKEGVLCDPAPKHLGGTPVVGMSIGSTLNMENYESLRVDVWLSVPVDVDSGETIEQAFSKVNKTLDRTLQDVVAQYTED